MVKIYVHTNFREMSQSTVELKLLPVSENRRPPYWNSTSGFDFDLHICLVTGMWFCVSLPNFVLIRRSAAELWRQYRFFKMAAIESKGYFQVQF